MRKNVKIIVRLLLCIALVMAMLGCKIEIYDGSEAEPVDLLGMWKTSNTTTKDGETVTIDKYMTFTFDDFTESFMTKTTKEGQTDKMLFFPEQLKFITSYTSTGLSLTVNTDESEQRTVIFDKTKKYLYVEGISDETYTQFEGEIPKHDLIGTWRSPTTSFPGTDENPKATSGYYEWGFSTGGMSKYKIVPELGYFVGGHTLMDGEWFVSVLQEGNQVTIKYEEFTGYGNRVVTIKRLSGTDTFTFKDDEDNDNTVYRKQ